MNEDNRDRSSAITGIKNLIWSLGIIVCVAAVVAGTVFAVFRRNRAGVASVSEITALQQQEAAGSTIVLGQGSGNERGVLNLLERTPDAGNSYIEGLTFLVDSTFINLRQMFVIDENQVWATKNGSMPMSNVSSALISFPADGSQITAASAAMVKQPEILVIGIGMDGLAKVDEQTFLINYETLINDIRSASPDTKIICCGLTSVIPGYTGSDGLGVSLVSDGNDWIQLVCRDTGAYYLDIGEELCESVQLLTRYAGSNGKTLNRTGLEEFLNYARTHAIP